MFRVYGNLQEGCAGIDLSFRQTDRWTVPDALRKAARPGESPFDTTALLLGDEDTGPLLLFFSVKPGVSLPDAPAHSHASDNFRISLRGILPMGSERYGPGEFRLQRGWKPYASDNYASGPDGGWSALLFGDRRGIRTRHVNHDVPSHEAADQLLADWLGIGGDLISRDDANTCGSSAVSTNLGRFSGSRVNSSFANAHTWPEVGQETHAGAALLGNPLSGPVLLLVETRAGALASSPYTFDTEVFHLVVSGTCTIGDDVHVAGDMNLYPAGATSAEIVAGPHGVQEMIVLGDRRRLSANPGDSKGWPAIIAKTVEELSRDIQPDRASQFLSVAPNNPRMARKP